MTGTHKDWTYAHDFKNAEQESFGIVSELALFAVAQVAPDGVQNALVRIHELLHYTLYDTPLEPSNLLAVAWNQGFIAGQAFESGVTVAEAEATTSDEEALALVQQLADQVGLDAVVVLKDDEDDNPPISGLI